MLLFHCIIYFICSQYNYILLKIELCLIYLIEYPNLRHHHKNIELGLYLGLVRSSSQLALEKVGLGSLPWLVQVRRLLNLGNLKEDFLLLVTHWEGNPQLCQFSSRLPYQSLDCQVVHKQFFLIQSCSDCLTQLSVIPGNISGNVSLPCHLLTGPQLQIYITI